MANPNPPNQFEPGKSGNPNGRPPKGYSITEMMKEMLKADPDLKKAIGKTIAKKALEGDLTAIKTLWQYMDGMPEQNVNQKIEGKLSVKIGNDGIEFSTEAEGCDEGTA